MEQSNMTALVSAFARAYHGMHYKVKIYDDPFAKQILTEDEYEQISLHMSKGIAFFKPDFIGTEEEALQWIVNQQLSPSPLGRAAFNEEKLANAVQIGSAEQYLIIAAGYDSFAYRQPEWGSRLEIFEIDHPKTSADKHKRISAFVDPIPENVHFVAADLTEPAWHKHLLKNGKFDQSKVSFCSLLGISYYLSKQDFATLIRQISLLLPSGSSIVFDYPDEYTFTDGASERVKKQVAIANAATEKMLASYSYSEIEKLLSDYKFLVFEHLVPEEITAQYFKSYNDANPAHPMTAFDHVNYCLAVKK